MPDETDQQAAFRLARHHSYAVLAAHQKLLPCAEIESTFAIQSGMAAVAVFTQDGLHGRRERCQRGGLCGRGRMEGRWRFRCRSATAQKGREKQGCEQLLNA